MAASSLFGFSSSPPIYAELFDHLSRLHEVERIEPPMQTSGSQNTFHF